MEILIFYITEHINLHSKLNRNY